MTFRGRILRYPFSVGVQPSGFSARADNVSSIELESPLPPEECVVRLREAIDGDGMLSLLGSKPVLGRVRGRSVRLTKRIGYRNSCQAILTGRFEPYGTGTVFRGTA